MSEVFFPALFPGFEPPEELAQALERLAVVHAELDRDARTIRLDAQAEKYLAEKQLQTLCRAVEKAYGLKSLELLVRYPEEELPHMDFRDLAQVFIRAFSPSAAILAGAQYTVEDNTVTIHLRANGKDSILQNAKKGEQFLRERFGVTKKIEVEAHSNLEGKALFEETARIRAEALKNTPAIQPSAQAPGAAPAARAPRSAPAPQEPTGALFYGRPFSGRAVRMDELNLDMFRVIVEGKVFAVQHRELKKRGAWVVCFDMTDYTSSVRVNQFMEAAKAKPIIDNVQAGMWLRVQGKMSFDRYDNEMVLQPTAMEKIEAPKRRDTYPEKRVELHLHTTMSSMDALTDAGAAVKRAASWGHRAIAITDHGGAQSFPDAMKAASKAKVAGTDQNIKILYGCEGYYVNDVDDRIAVHGDGDFSFDEEYVAFDLETTGLSSLHDTIIEIGAAIMKGKEVLSTFQMFVDPHRPLQPKIIDLTGITDQMLAGQPDISEAIPQFLDYVGGRPLCAHNADFDIGFVTAACERLGIAFQPTYVDTLILAQNLMPELGKYKLNIVADALSLPDFNHHRASDDAITCGYLLMRFFKMLQEQGIDHLQAINPRMEELRSGSKIMDRRARHIIVFAKNSIGLRNLYRLISYGNLKYFRRVPIMPKSEILQWREGLIIGSACEAGELFQAILNHKSWAELKRIASFYDFLEIQPICNNRFMLDKGLAEDEEELRGFNRTIVRLGEELGKPVVATGDVHFLDPEDEIFRHILLATKQMPDADRPLPLYLRTTDEMMAEFAYLGEEKAREVVIDNPAKIAARIGEIGLYPKHPEGKETFQPFWPDAADNIRNLCEEQIREWFGDNPPEIVVARKEKELSSILGYGYGTLYNIAEKLVKKSNADGYLVGSRGSVGSSYVAHLVGISEVNALPPHYRCPKCKWYTFDVDKSKYKVGVDLPPMKCPQCGEELYRDGFDIPFEVFLGFKGDKVPDIDLNFSGVYQPRAHAYIEELFGKGYCYRAGTIGTLADKTAYGYVKKYCEERELTLSEAEMNRLALGCVGVKRTTGQHPAGMVVLPKEYEIQQFVAIQHPANDMTSPVITTHYDFGSMHDVLVKLDVLGHDDPTMIRMLMDLTGVDARTLPLTDPDVISLFSGTQALGVTPEQIGSKTGTYGVPEFGTKFVRQMLEETHPTTMEELIRISGLSHGTDVWIGNAQEIIKAGIAPLASCICCRDDIMNALIDYGVAPKMSFDTMESVRKGRGLKPEMEEAMIEHNVPSWFIDSCKKIKYMFPKGHAVAYVTMALRIAWYKVHRPAAYYCAYYTVRADCFDASILGGTQEAIRGRYKEMEENSKDLTQKDKDLMIIMELVIEMLCRGIKLAPVDLYKSDATKFQVVDEKTIRMPFNALPGLGEAAAQSIVDAREQSPFISIEDLRNRTKISASLIDLLREGGCLGGLPESNQTTLFSF